MGLLLIIAAIFQVWIVPGFAAKPIWRNLTQTELSGWYSPTDLCVMESQDIKTFPNDIRSKHCVQHSRGNRRTYCAVGMGSNNFPCYGPYSSSRLSFYKGIDGFTDPKPTPLIEAFYDLIATNSTLVFIGDSTMRQKFQALECELLRENPKIKTNGNMWGVLPCDTTLNIWFPDGNHIQMIAISMGPNSRDCLKGGKGKFAPAAGAYENAEDIVRRINNEQGRSVVVLANIGLWYNDEADFLPVMPLVLAWLLRVARVPNMHNVVAWHETMSQHWNNSIGSGYFSKSYADETEERYWHNISKIPIDQFHIPTSCTPITNTSFMADWRNDLVRKLLMDMPQEDRELLPVFPFAKYTRDLADMHTTNPLFKHDCTHYCYTPFLWQPLWYQLRDLTRHQRSLYEKKK